MPSLQVNEPLSATVQQVSDDSGVLSPIHLSTSSVGIGTTAPEVPLDVAGDVKLEYNGSPRITLFSRGNGTQRYSIRATNDKDDAGGKSLVFRNESGERDDLVLDSSGNLKLEHIGSPTITLFSRGDGTQMYSIRATNDSDDAGGRSFVIRNESHDRDDIILGNDGTVRFPGDIVLSGADCAEDFQVAPGAALEPGTVVVVGDSEEVWESSEEYDRRVAGVVSGAGGYRPGIVLGRGPSRSGDVPVALTGRVFCKVDARFRPIEVGDPLTTSSTPGHAMKADDSLKSFGAVLGKALRPLSDQTDLIPILVALQ